MPLQILLPINNFNEFKKYSPGIRLVPKDFDYLLRGFSKYIADEIVSQVKLAIDSQRYCSRWAPLSVSYLDYKRKNRLSTKVWEASSFLKDNIRAYRSGNYYVVGVNKRVKYPGTNLPAWKVLFWMEFGTARMPARPLFRLIIRNIRSHIRRYWVKFLQSDVIIKG